LEPALAPAFAVFLAPALEADFAPALAVDLVAALAAGATCANTGETMRAAVRAATRTLLTNMETP
jgi:hypothetical protein